MSEVKTGKEIRVLHVTEAAAGGVLRHLEYILPGLQDRGCRCACLIFSDRFDDEHLRRNLRIWQQSGVGVHFLRMPGHWLRKAGCWLRIVRELQRLIREFDPEVIHLHSSIAGGIGRMLLRVISGKCRICYSPHAFYWHPEMALIRRMRTAAAERILCRETDRYVLVGPGEIQQGEQMGLAWRGKHVMIPNGLPRQWCAGQLSRAEARHRLGIPEEELAAVIPGRLAWQKGQIAFLEMLRNLDWPEHCRIYFYGAGISELAAGEFGRDAGERFVFREEMPDLNRCLQAFDLGIQPSRYEGFAYAMLEMLSAGLPVLARDSEENRMLQRKIPDGCDRIFLWQDLESFRYALEQKPRRRKSAEDVPRIFSLDGQLEALAGQYRDMIR